MKKFKLSTVCFSATGTTAKIVRAVAEGTDLPAVDYKILKLYNPPAVPAFSFDDFVIIAAPVYVGRIPPAVKEIFSELSGKDTPCAIIGVYGNRNYDDFLVELEDLVRERGFLPIAGAAFVGEHSFSNTLAAGRPNADDLKKAREFGRNIAKKLASGDLSAPVIPGSRPYKEPYGGSGKRTPFGPEIFETCTECGICTSVCPRGAISEEREVEPALCIRCYKCVKSCPNGSIRFTNKQFSEHVVHLETVYADCKPVELFI